MTTAVNSDSAASPHPISFRQRSQNAAKRFLQTVVLIDDQAHFTPTSPEEATKENLAQLRQAEAETGSKSGDPADDVNGVIASPEISGIDDVLPDNLPILNEPTPRQFEEGLRHDLDAQELISCFAGEGLVCAVLKPQIGNVPTVLGEAVRAARRADVVIVDWQIIEKNGKNAIRLVTDILDEDQKSGGRLRLLVVYTGETKLYDIAKEIHQSLSTLNGVGLTLDQENPILSSDSVRIVVLAKQLPENAPKDFDVNAKNRVSVEELPTRIFEEFAQMTGGLVTNTALVSLSVVREKTHSVLSKMHKRLDAPFLTHRILIAQPEDASEFLVSLVGEELRSIINTKDVYAQTGFDAIQVWMDESHSGASLSVLDDNNNSTPLDKELIKRLIQLGGEAFSGAGIPGLKRNSAHKKLTHALSRLQDKAKASTFDEEFAMLTTLQTRYEGAASTPLLSLGVILAKIELQSPSIDLIQKDGEGAIGEGKTSYWLCIQPPCDSIRIKTPTDRFPLLPLSISNDNKFHLIVPSGKPNERERLKLTKKLSKCEIVEFKVENGCVQARLEGGRFIFDSSQGLYYHVAQMKFVNAQAAINGFSAELSRVGTDISEWLRSFE